MRASHVIRHGRSGDLAGILLSAGAIRLRSSPPPAPGRRHRHRPWRVNPGHPMTRRPRRAVPAGSRDSVTFVSTQELLSRHGPCSHAHAVERPHADRGASWRGSAPWCRSRHPAVGRVGHRFRRRARVVFVTGCGRHRWRAALDQRRYRRFDTVLAAIDGQVLALTAAARRRAAARSPGARAGRWPEAWSQVTQVRTAGITDLRHDPTRRTWRGAGRSDGRGHHYGA